MSEQIVKNTDEGYGYKYASLSALAKQGFVIPKMKTALTDNGVEYVYFYDEELHDWIQGARVVMPELDSDKRQKMNKAQLYGAALTYARRYTTQMCLGLACEDDKELEASAPSTPSKSDGKITDNQLYRLKQVYKGDNLTKLLQAHNLKKLEDMSSSTAYSIISKLNGNKK